MIITKMIITLIIITMKFNQRRKTKLSSNMRYGCHHFMFQRKTECNGSSRDEPSTHLSDGTVNWRLVLVHLALGKSPAGFDPITLHE